jgi:hypothetical protein
MTYESFDQLLRSVERLLAYDPETGVFTWKCDKGSKAKAGAVAGFAHSAGYWTLTVDNQRVLAHRLAWALCYRADPEGLEIDHINRDRRDNRIANLRLVDRTTNQRNRGANKNNKCGLRGVSYHRQTGKWRASLGYGYKSTHLGLYSTPQEAHVAFLAAA